MCYVICRALVSTIIQELEAARSRYTDVVVALFYRNPSTPTKSNDDILAVLKRLTLIHDASTENDEILRLTSMQYVTITITVQLLHWHLSVMYIEIG